MATLTFETGYADLAVSGSCDCFEVGGTAPQSIIKTDQAWFVRVNLITTGVGTASFTGSFQIRLFLEGMGTTPDVDLPILGPQIQSLVLGVSPVSYPPIDINIPAGTVPAGSYKLVTVVNYLDGLNNPGMIAGFVDMPYVQFFDV